MYLPKLVKIRVEPIPFIIEPNAANKYFTKELAPIEKIPVE